MLICVKTAGLSEPSLSGELMASQQISSVMALTLRLGQ